jgi:hypothetical protein
MLSQLNQEVVINTGRLQHMALADRGAADDLVNLELEIAEQETMAKGSGPNPHLGTFNG